MIKMLITCFYLYTQSSQAAPTDRAIIAHINGLPVEKSELSREMTRYRAGVYAHGAGHTSQLRTQAFAAIKRIKVTEEELKRNNLWPYQDYQEFLRSFDKTNAERRKAASEGKPVYGPVKYDEITYFDYCFTNAVLKFQSSKHITDQAYRRLIAKRMSKAKVVQFQKLN
jgi:hypothetical protein